MHRNFEFMILPFFLVVCCCTHFVRKCKEHLSINMNAETVLIFPYDVVYHDRGLFNQAGGACCAHRRPRPEDPGGGPSEDFFWGIIRLERIFLQQYLPGMYAIRTDDLLCWLVSNHLRVTQMHVYTISKLFVPLIMFVGYWSKVVHVGQIVILLLPILL